MYFVHFHRQTESRWHGKFTDQLEPSPQFLVDFQILFNTCSSFSWFSFVLPNIFALFFGLPGFHISITCFIILRHFTMLDIILFIQIIWKLYNWAWNLTFYLKNSRISSILTNNFQDFSANFSCLLPRGLSRFSLQFLPQWYSLNFPDCSKLDR